MSDSHDSEHDVIVIGAGSAGCVVASRLSEDGGERVLVLEAGVSDDYEPLQEAIRIPKYFQFMQKSIADWDYETEPEPGLDGRRIYCPRGKILGGTSTFIAGLVVRGNRRNYDGWAEEVGDPSWRWEALLPYFKSLERNLRPDIGELHGTDGTMTVTDIEVHPATKAFFAAASWLGWDHTEDFNDYEQQGGASPYQMYETTQGIRVNSANSYLRPEVRRRPNLTIETEAEVRRIVFDDARRAVAVEYVQGGATRTARARREIVLAGGAINSPKLLMLSGVGPAAHLRDRGIAVVHDLPGVGQNYHDHPIAGVAWAYKSTVRPPDTSSAGIEGGLFLGTRPDLTAPNLQMVFNAGNVGPPQTVPDWGVFAAVGANVQPQSRGHVELAAGDPHGKPRIFANLVTEPEDMAVLVAAVRLGRELVATHHFDRFRGQEIAPGPDVTTDAEIEAYVRQTAGVLFHPVGTCRMGRDPADGAVVDAQLRVFGVQGLRVVDASIMPVITTGNTHTPTTVIGEKGAAMIQSGTTTRVHRRSRYRVRPSGLPAVRRAVAEYVAWARENEPGIGRYEVVEAEGGGELVHIAEFDDDATLEASQRTPQYGRLVDVLGPNLEGGIDVDTTRGSSLAVGGSRGVSENDFKILVRFIVKNRRDIPRFREIIAEDLHLHRSRGEPAGLVTFEAFADPKDDRRYFYSQRWVSAAAQQRATETFVNFAETVRITRPEVLNLFEGPG